MKPILTAEEMSEPITTALYNSGIHNTDYCDQLAENILTVLQDHGYYIVRTSQFNQSEEDYVPGVHQQPSASVASHSSSVGNNIEQQQKDSSQ